MPPYANCFGTPISKSKRKKAKEKKKEAGENNCA